MKNFMQKNLVALGLILTTPLAAGNLNLNLSRGAIKSLNVSQEIGYKETFLRLIKKAEQQYPHLPEETSSLSFENLKRFLEPEELALLENCAQQWLEEHPTFLHKVCKTKNVDVSSLAGELLLMESCMRSCMESCMESFLETLSSDKDHALARLTWTTPAEEIERMKQEAEERRRQEEAERRRREEEREERRRQEEREERRRQEEREERRRQEEREERQRQEEEEHRRREEEERRRQEEAERQRQHEERMAQIQLEIEKEKSKS